MQLLEKEHLVNVEKPSYIIHLLVWELVCYPKNIFIKKLQNHGFVNCKHEPLTFGLTSIYTAIKK